jgi:hypothetical protein
VDEWLENSWSTTYVVVGISRSHHPFECRMQLNPSSFLLHKLYDRKMVIGLLWTNSVREALTFELPMREVLVTCKSKRGYLTYGSATYHMYLRTWALLLVTHPHHIPSLRSCVLILHHATVVSLMSSSTSFTCSYLWWRFLRTPMATRLQCPRWLRNLQTINTPSDPKLLILRI